MLLRTDERYAVPAEPRKRRQIDLLCRAGSSAITKYSTVSTKVQIIFRDIPRKPHGTNERARLEKSAPYGPDARSARSTKKGESRFFQNCYDILWHRRRCIVIIEPAAETDSGRLRKTRPRPGSTPHRVAGTYTRKQIAAGSTGARRKSGRDFFKIPKRQKKAFSGKRFQTGLKNEGNRSRV